MAHQQTPNVHSGLPAGTQLPDTIAFSADGYTDQLRTAILSHPLHANTYSHAHPLSGRPGGLHNSIASGHDSAVGSNGDGGHLFESSGFHAVVTAQPSTAASESSATGAISSNVHVGHHNHHTANSESSAFKPVVAGVNTVRSTGTNGRLYFGPASDVKEAQPVRAAAARAQNRPVFRPRVATHHNFQAQPQPPSASAAAANQQHQTSASGVGSAGGVWPDPTGAIADFGRRYGSGTSDFGGTSVPLAHQAYEAAAQPTVAHDFTPRCVICGISPPHPRHVVFSWEWKTNICVACMLNPQPTPWAWMAVIQNSAQHPGMGNGSQ